MAKRGGMLIPDGAVTTRAAPSRPSDTQHSTLLADLDTMSMSLNRTLVGLEYPTKVPKWDVNLAPRGNTINPSMYTTKQEQGYLYEQDFMNIIKIFIRGR